MKKKGSKRTPDDIKRKRRETPFAREMRLDPFYRAFNEARRRVREWARDVRTLEIGDVEAGRAQEAARMMCERWCRRYVDALERLHEAEAR